MTTEGADAVGMAGGRGMGGSNLWGSSFETDGQDLTHSREIGVGGYQKVQYLGARALRSTSS